MGRFDRMPRYVKARGTRDLPRMGCAFACAVALHTSTDFLLFDEHARGPSDDLRLQFEAVSQFLEEERKIVKALLEGMIIKFQTKQMVGNLSS